MKPQEYKSKIIAFQSTGSLVLELSIPKEDLKIVKKAAESLKCYCATERTYKGQVKVLITRKSESFY